MHVDWHGIFPAVTTLFKKDEAVDSAATLRHLNYLIDAGCDGLILLGTVGENCSLEYREKIDFLQAAAEGVAGRVPVLAGVAECSTATACRFAADAQKAGVDGLMVLPAMVYKSDPRETLHHYRAVARATDRPVMIYNNPVSYFVDVTPEMLADLAEEPKFVAVKESSENVRRITDIRNLLGDRFLLFCGVDDLILESLLLGVDGWVAGLVNAFPAESRRLWDLASAGKWDEARPLYRWFAPLLHLDTHVKLVQYIKLAMQECGAGAEWTRAPRLAVEGREREQILAIIRQAIQSRPAAAMPR